MSQTMTINIDGLNISRVKTAMERAISLNMLLAENDDLDKHVQDALLVIADFLYVVDEAHRQLFKEVGDDQA